MLKNLFKAAKQALKNPIVQLGIGALIPGSSFVAGMAPGIAKTVLSNPALLQGGIGLLSGDKPENVARNIGIQALLGGFRGMQDPSSTFGEGVKGTFRSATTGNNIPQGGTASITGEGNIPTIGSAEQVAKAAPETFLGRLGESVTDPSFLINAASLALPFVAASQMKDDQIQVDPEAISGLNLSNYRAALEASPYQSMAAAGGIQGFARGGADPTNGMNQVSYGSTMGEPNGLFTGPGGPKEDKIDVMLSPGEFVMTAEATKKIGVDNLYDMMNKVDPDSERPDEYRQRVGMA
tara:strand:+ start:60 stop:941 length:882 start_codon:yes stop_codon:yes gene_type:complete